MSRRGARGVTLIELLVAVALGFILIMFAIPSYNAWTADAELSSAASSIADGLRQASAEAIKRNTAIEFLLTPGVGWVARNAATGAVITQDRLKEGSQRAALTTSPVGTNMVTFNAIGGVETVNADASAPIDWVNVDVTGAGRPLRVVIGVTRNGVRVCDRRFTFATDPKGC